MPKTRSETGVFLIGNYLPQIVTSKLPSNQDVMRVFFFNLREVGLSVSQSANLVIKEVLPFWNKARIPTKNSDKCVKILLKLYNEWQALQKSHQKKNAAGKNARFCEKLPDLFDIAHQDALTMVQVEDRKFLLAQREKGRKGFMFGVDWNLHRKELRAEERKTEEAKRSQKNLEDLAEEVCYLEASNESDDESDSVKPESLTKEKLKRSTKNLVTPRIVAAFNKCKVSDRNAMYIISAIVDSLGLDLSSFTINRTSFQRSRRKLRKDRADRLKENFKDSDLTSATIHWDGKLLNDLTDSNKHDRVAIIITSRGSEQILSIPALENGTGRAQADAVYAELVDWDLTDRLKALFCDTTNTNLGRLNGAAVLLEQMLEKDLLYLPCRHHIYELVLRSAFDLKMPPSTSPEVPLFKKFQGDWSKIDPIKFKTSLEDANFSKKFDKDRLRIIEFTEETLKIQQPRADYREFLGLTQIFLGKVDPKPTIRPPGPFHHARWMAKAIYILKIYLFRHQFKLSKAEHRIIKELCLFIVLVYVEAWYNAPLATRAPYHDLLFVQKLIEYEKVDAAVSRAALSKFEGHLWYLNPEASALAFFDDKVSVESKKKMVSNLQVESAIADDGQKRLRPENIHDFQSKNMSDFICSSSKLFFKRFNLQTELLKEDPSKWPDSKQFKKNFDIVKNLKVVNDVAERGVKLIEEFSKSLTKNEEQRQFVLRVVSDYRKKFPDTEKSTLGKNV